jgi:hypothetical protein
MEKVFSILGVLAITVSGTLLPATNIKGVDITPHASTGTSNGTLTVRIENDNTERAISTPTEMTAVDRTVVIGANSVILGHSDYLNEAVIICGSNMVPERAIGYSMRVIGNWLVGIEYYPNHLSPSQTATDVVLVRDLGNQPCKKERAGGAGGERELTVAAGRPVYPIANATKLSYRNVLEGHRDTVVVIPNTFVILGDEKLVFVAAQMSASGRGPSFVVSIDLRGKPSSSKLTSLENIAKAIGVDSSTQLEITNAEPAGPQSIRLHLQKGSYRQDEIVVPLN